MTPLERLVEIAVEVVGARLGDDVSILTATPLPRGSDPFVGGERPMLVVGTRWAAIPPGGVLVGGGPASVAAVLGFELPPRDGAGKPGAEAEATGAGNQDATPAVEAASAPKLGAAAAAAWSEEVCSVARTHVAPFSVDIAHRLAERVKLPLDCAPPRVALTETPRTEVGPIPDGVVLVLGSGEHELRLVIVAPGVVLARLEGDPTSGEPAAPINGPLPRAPGDPGSCEDDAESDARPANAIERTLSQVPLDVSLRVGRAYKPLKTVLALRPGDLFPLEQSADDPVELVAGTTRVATGEIETTDDGLLQFKVVTLAADRSPIPPPPPKAPKANVASDGPAGSPPLTAIEGGAGGPGGGEAAGSGGEPAGGSEPAGSGEPGEAPSAGKDGADGAPEADGEGAPSDVQNEEVQPGEAPAADGAEPPAA